MFDNASLGVKDKTSIDGATWFHSPKLCSSILVSEKAMNVGLIMSINCHMLLLGMGYVCTYCLAHQVPALHMRLVIHMRDYILAGNHYIRSYWTSLLFKWIIYVLNKLRFTAQIDNSHQTNSAQPVITILNPAVAGRSREKCVQQMSVHSKTPPLAFPGMNETESRRWLEQTGKEMERDGGRGVGCKTRQHLQLPSLCFVLLEGPENVKIGGNKLWNEFRKGAFYILNIDKIEYSPKLWATGLKT